MVKSSSVLESGEIIQNIYMYFLHRPYKVCLYHLRLHQKLIKKQNQNKQQHQQKHLLQRLVRVQY